MIKQSFHLFLVSLIIVQTLNLNYLIVTATQLNWWKKLAGVEHFQQKMEHDHSPNGFPFQDPSLPWDQRVDDLIGRLTLEEIVPQTQTIYGSFTPAIPRLNILPYQWITECLHGQCDSNATAFPQAIGLAASFSHDLLYNVSFAISNEVRGHWNGNRKAGKYALGLSCFSPVINIMRHPLWGRNQETYGEDPYLSGKLVQGFVHGLQGDHPRYVRANAGCKHYNVHGGPENIPVSRFSFDSKVSMSDWRMTFLPQFKMCVEAGTYSLMCSFNSINGVPACANELLLTNITRKEWGFKGYIVSDDDALSNMISSHHYFKTAAETAAGSIKAGCNLELTDGTSIFNSQLDALKQGLVTEKQLRDNVRPLFYTRMRLGEFDPEDMNPYNSINMSVVQSADHRQLALEAAMKTFVLLKNSNNLLPLTKSYKKLALVGPFVNQTDQLFGDYSSRITKEFTSSLPDGLAKLASSSSLGPGCFDTHCNAYNSTEVVDAVVGADIAVVALGTGQALESEGNDRYDLNLPGQQLQLLLDVVNNVNKGVPIILLLFNGGPLDITWAKLSPSVTAIVECFFPGQSAGTAIYNMLTGNGGASGVPAGRLPCTWPSFLKQVPPITDYSMAGHTYRYYKGEPLYPFGYGLSYTSFVYTSLTVSPDSVTSWQNVTVTVGVLNAGNMAADEVIQVYIMWPNNVNVPVPKIQLVAFDRQQFSPGEHRLVTLVIEAERFAVWGENDWIFVKGVMTVYVGGQQPEQVTHAPSNVLQGSFAVL